MEIGFLKKFEEEIRARFFNEIDKAGVVLTPKKVIRTITESFVYTIVILIICYFIPFLRNNFLELNLHPLAIMVALMSLKYGIYQGLISGLVATVGYLFIYIISGNDLVLYFLKFQYYKFFLMFLFIAMILGKFQSDYKLREEEEKTKNNNLNKLIKEEKMKNNDLLNINKSLKNQIIQGKGGIITFQNVRKKLRKILKVEEIYTEAISMLNQFIECENASIYTIEKTNLNQIIKVGNGLLNKRLDLNDKNAERFLEVYKSRKITEFPIDLEAKGPIFIAPLFYGKNIISFLEVSRLAYEVSKSESFELFKIIIEEINFELNRIFKLDNSNKLKKFHSKTSIITKEYFETISEEVKKRKKLYNQNYSIIEGINYKKYNFEKLNNKLEEMRKTGYVSDYVTCDKENIKFLFINETEKNNEKQLKILKNILKEEKLYEI